jgi:hypothetical protein
VPAKLNVIKVRDLLQNFDFRKLFIEELGWSQPASNKEAKWECSDASFTRRQVAELSGVVVLEVSAPDGLIPSAKVRAAIHKDIEKLHHENLIIFVDVKRTQSLWYWVKREDSRKHPREHIFVKGQPGDLFISKINSMVFDIGDFDREGRVPVLEVADRLAKALNVERVTKKFYGEFEQEHIEFLNLIEGIENDRDRRWYASVMLNRLMFIYFLQKKGFIDDDNRDYLQSKLKEAEKKFGKGSYYEKFLKLLFFEGFAKPEDKRSKEANAILGKVRYLNGGLFLPHQIEQKNPDIKIPDKAFENLYALFTKYSWNLNDTPGGDDNEINPDVLGYIFEKYINQKAFGAYYTRPQITEYLCEQTIYKLVLEKINTTGIPGVTEARQFDSVSDLLLALDTNLCRKLLNNILPNLKLLDPACGSGAFLVSAMKTLINLYSAVIGKIQFLSDRNLSKWLRDAQAQHASMSYFIKKRIITDNLFGVDIMEEGTEIARLRLFLALVASAENAEQLEPLPNIDFNILTGNSLIGLIRVDDKRFEARNKKGALGGMLFKQKSYRELLIEKNRLIDNYRHDVQSYSKDLRSLRDSIDEKKKLAVQTLNDMLLDEFQSLGIKFSQVTWDIKKQTEGKPIKRSLKPEDIDALQPFHWGYEFDEVFEGNGGFDAIITNPPWETFQPDAKEFFSEYSELVTKKKMDIKEFQKELERLLRDREIMDAWLDYHSKFNHQRDYFRFAPQYENQVPIIDGKRHGKDVNLYKLFVEQCYRLLRSGGQCGIVIPSGIYTDLGAKKLREMLFTQSEITGLFCFENRKEVFEGVDSRFKFVVLTYKKGGKTESFPAAFMRHDVEELERFPKEGGLDISVALIRKISPDSLSVMEFKSDMDVRIAEKMLKYPLLGDDVASSWKLELHREFNMTDDAPLFQKEPGTKRLPLFEGKMIWHYSHTLARPRFWVDANKGRQSLLGTQTEAGQQMGYQKYRLAYRSVASSTNERSMVATVIPPSFTGNSLNVCETLDSRTQFFVVAVLDSFSIDWLLRNMVTTNINMFYVYQLPVPRFTKKDPAFAPIVERAAKLICTTSEFDDLAKEVGLGSHKRGVKDETGRAILRAELDGLIAHLYGLTEVEFTHILSAFPIVPDPVKIAAHNAYRDVERGLIK